MNSNSATERGPTAPGVSAHPREVMALLAVSIGMLPGSLGVLAVQGFALGLPALIWGLFLASRSDLWSPTQKGLVAAIPTLCGTGLIIAAYTITHFTMQDEDVTYVPPWQVAAKWIAFLSLFIVPIAVAVYLNRAARRAAQRQADLRRAQRPPADW